MNKTEAPSLMAQWLDKQVALFDTRNLPADHPRVVGLLAEIGAIEVRFQAATGRTILAEVCP